MSSMESSDGYGDCIGEPLSAVLRRDWSSLAAREALRCEIVQTMAMCVRLWQEGDATLNIQSLDEQPPRTPEYGVG